MCANTNAPLRGRYVRAVITPNIATIGPLAGRMNHAREDAYQGCAWKPGFQACRARNVRMCKRHLEKRVNRYVEKGECHEPVEGMLKHFTKQYEKMHWVAAATPQDYVDRLTNNRLSGSPTLIGSPITFRSWCSKRYVVCKSPGKHHLSGSRCSRR